MMKLKRQEIILLLAIWGVVGVLLVVAVITLRTVRGGPGADELGASSTPTLVPLYTPPPGDISAAVEPVVLRLIVHQRRLNNDIRNCT